MVVIDKCLLKWLDMLLLGLCDRSLSLDMGLHLGLHLGLYCLDLGLNLCFLFRLYLSMQLCLFLLMLLCNALELLLANLMLFLRRK